MSGHVMRAWRVAPDPRRRDSDWWDYARAAHNTPAAVKPLLDPMPVEGIVLTDAEAVEVERWAASLPDWEAQDPAFSRALDVS